METLYDAQADKVAQATLGELKEGDKTGPAVKTVKLLAQSTGDLTRDELKKVVKLSWTDKAKAEIAAAKGSLTPGPSPTGEGSGNTGGSSGDNTGGNTGGDNGGGSAGFETGG